MAATSMRSPHIPRVHLSRQKTTACPAVIFVSGELSHHQPVRRVTPVVVASLSQRDLRSDLKIYEGVVGRGMSGWASGSLDCHRTHKVKSEGEDAAGRGEYGSRNGSKAEHADETMGSLSKGCARRG